MVNSLNVRQLNREAVRSLAGLACLQKHMFPRRDNVAVAAQQHGKMLHVDVIPVINGIQPLTISAAGRENRPTKLTCRFGLSALEPLRKVLVGEAYVGLGAWVNQCSQFPIFPDPAQWRLLPYESCIGANPSQPDVFRTEQHM
jgi:hypothetical protein